MLIVETGGDLCQVALSSARLLREHSFESHMSEFTRKRFSQAVQTFAYCLAPRTPRVTYPRAFSNLPNN